MQISLTPDMAMRVLRYVLVRYRILSHRSQEDAAAQLGLKQPSIANFEAGRNAPTRPNLFSLLDFYGRRAQYNRLLPVRDLAARRRRTESVSIGLVTDIELMLGLEFFAVGVEVYAPVLIDGLLQTEAYGRWVIEQGASQLGLNVDETLQLRMDRQVVLHRDDDDELASLSLRMFVQESALRRPIGGANKSVMVDQLDYLTQQARRRNIDILVVPDSVIYHRAMRGLVRVLAFDDDIKVAYAEDFQSSHCYDSPGALANAAVLMTELRAVALGPRQSMRLITDIREELGSP